MWGSTEKLKISFIFFFISLFAICNGCVSPGAVQAKLNLLEHKVEQKANNDVVAEQIEEVNNKIEQTTQVAEKLVEWRKSVQAETINYGGAGWVVIGLILMVIVFLGAIGLFIMWGFKKYIKYKGMLSLVTTAVHKSSPDTQKEIKRQIRNHASNGDKSQARHKCNLAKHCRNDGVFAHNS